MVTALKVEEKLGKNVFKVNKEGHIRIETDVCRLRCVNKYCLYVCPAKVYSLDPNGNVPVWFRLARVREYRSWRAAR